MLEVSTTSARASASPRRSPIRHADCIEIPLGHGRSAIVDLDCPAWILAYSWSAAGRSRRYAACNRDGKRVKLHRAILGLVPGDVSQVDHIDGDCLNNRRANLRLCTNRQNHANQGSRPGSTSRFRGVSWDTRRGMWCARLGLNTDGRIQSKHVGYFDTEEEAAHAWDAAAIASGWYDPAFLRLNFPVEQGQ